LGVPETEVFSSFPSMANSFLSLQQTENGMSCVLPLCRLEGKTGNALELGIGCDLLDLSAGVIAELAEGDGSSRLDLSREGGTSPEKDGGIFGM
jgi:hypothetical protein